MSGENLTGLLKERLSADVLEILRALGGLAKDRGTRAYLVGGAVRDLLLGTSGVDLDVLVDEDAAGFAAATAGRLGGTVTNHTRFGTAVVILKGGRRIDVAAARTESYEHPGALPDVAPGALDDDLRRRDFSVNAMAVALNPDAFGKLLDCCGGLEDLSRGVLTILTPSSFDDDPVRILRAARLAGRLDFHLEAETKARLLTAIAGGALATVSGERLMHELVVTLEERRPWPAVSRLSRWRALDAIARGWIVPPQTEAVFDRIAGPTEGTAGEDDEGADEEAGGAWPVYLLAVLEPVGVDVREVVLGRLRPGRRARTLTRNIERFEETALPRLTSDEEIGDGRLFRLLDGFPPAVLTFARARWPEVEGPVAHYLTELRGTKPLLTGADVEALGVPRGPSVGGILDALLEARLDGRISSREEEEELAVRLASELDEGRES